MIEAKSKFYGMLLDALGATLGNLLAGKGVIRAGNRCILAGVGVFESGQDFIKMFIKKQSAKCCE